MKEKPIMYKDYLKDGVEREVVDKEDAKTVPASMRVGKVKYARSFPRRHYVRDN